MRNTVNNSHIPILKPEIESNNHASFLRILNFFDKILFYLQVLKSYYFPLRPQVQLLPSTSSRLLGQLTSSLLLQLDSLTVPLSAWLDIQILPEAQHGEVSSVTLFSSFLPNHDESN